MPDNNRENKLNRKRILDGYRIINLNNTGGQRNNERNWKTKI